MSPDDPLEGVHRRIDRMGERITRFESMGIQQVFEALRGDIGELKSEVAKLRDESLARERQAVTEKKADRRWAVGVAFTVATLVVGAVALLLQAFGGA